jgi:hypothetical protein
MDKGLETLKLTKNAAQASRKEKLYHQTFKKGLIQTKTFKKVLIQTKTFKKGLINNFFTFGKNLD